MSRPRNPVVCGRKFCARCGCWRRVCDFAYKADRRTPYGARLDSYCDACRRVMWRERYRHMTPRQREARREAERFYRDRVRRERGTIGSYRPRGRSKVDRKERVLLDPAPLLAAIENWASGEIDGYEPETRDLVTWRNQLAFRAGVPPRTVWRLTSGDARHVRLDTADKFAVALGVPLALIYPGP